MKRRCLGRGRGEANVLRFVTGSFSYGTNCTYIVIFPFQKKKPKNKNLELFICFKNQDFISPWFRADAALAVFSESHHTPHPSKKEGC